MRRTQIMLTDDQYLVLKRESERSGRSIGDLVRSAVAQVYNRSQQRAHKALRKSRGAWADRDDITGGAAYVEQIRQPLADRLQDAEWA